MGFDSKHEFTPPTSLLGLLPCPWVWKSPPHSLSSAGPLLPRCQTSPWSVPNLGRGVPSCGHSLQLLTGMPSPGLRGPWCPRAEQRPQSLRREAGHSGLHARAVGMPGGGGRASSWPAVALGVGSGGCEPLKARPNGPQEASQSPGCQGTAPMLEFGLGVEIEARQKLIEFCQENALVIANILFQQHKMSLYTWTCPDGQH